MAITDNLIVRVQPETGDTEIKNLIDDEVFSGGGVATLTDVNGEAAFKISDGRLALTGVPMNALQGGSNRNLTLAFRMRINSWAGISTSANILSIFDGGTEILSWERDNGGTATQLSFRNSSTARQYFGVNYGASGIVYTVVLNWQCTSANNTCYMNRWLNKDPSDPSRPPSTSSFTDTAWRTPDEIRLDSGTGSDYEILDLMVWNRKLTDAEASDVADDIRSVLPTSADVPVQFNGVVPTTNALAEVAYSQGVGSYFTTTFTPVTYAITTGQLPSGLTIDTSTGAITGTIDTDDPQTTIVVTATDSALNTAVTNAFDITCDVTNWGLTRQQIENADLTGGLHPPFLVGDFDAGDLVTDRFKFTVDTQPIDGTLTTYANSTFVFSDAADGVYSFTYTAYKNGVSYGTGTVNLTVGVVSSTLSITSTNVPDGDYSADIYNNITKTLIETKDLTFVDGDSSLIESVAASTELWVLIKGSNPPITGLAYIGVTE